MTKKILPLFLISLTILSGCGSNSSVVQASAPSIPAVGPESFFCAPANQGDVCSFVHYVKDAQGNTLFYCQGETHVFPLTHTMSWHLEIGVSSLIQDPNLSGCLVTLPDRVILANMKGTLSLIPWTGNPTSIATWVYAQDAGQKAVLYPGKIAATKGISVAVPMEGSSGQPLVFPNSRPADNILVWFNIDLAGSVPATISLSGASDTE